MDAIVDQLVLGKFLADSRQIRGRFLADFGNLWATAHSDFVERFPGQSGKFDFSIWRVTCLILVPSKLPAANSRSGSTEGHGANGNLFSMGVLSAVCGFSLKLDAKKHGRRRNKL